MSITQSHISGQQQHARNSAAGTVQHRLHQCSRVATTRGARPLTKDFRRRVLCRWTNVQTAAVAETLAPVTLTQTQESVELLKKTRLITAIKTPYREDGKFDLRAYDAHVQRQIENGVEGLIVGGTTGKLRLPTAKHWLSSSFTLPSLVRMAAEHWQSRLSLNDLASAHCRRGAADELG